MTGNSLLFTRLRKTEMKKKLRGHISSLLTVHRFNYQFDIAWALGRRYSPVDKNHRIKVKNICMNDVMEPNNTSNVTSSFETVWLLLAICLSPFICARA